MFREFPATDGTSGNSCILYETTTDTVLGPPLLFSWLAAPGVFTCDLSIMPAFNGEALFTNARLMPYLDGNIPTGIACTKFHLIMLYADRAAAVCLLNNEISWDYSLAQLVDSVPSS